MKLSKQEEPLLYVDQGILQAPKRRMQTEYYAVMEKGKDLGKDQALDNPSFSQMTIDERIDYLLRIPRNYFQMKCKVTTQEQVYYGSLVEKEAGKVVLLDFKRQAKYIEEADILQIDLIGL